MLSEPDLRRLSDDIAANGLRHPIVLDHDGAVLDGRNRLAACKLASVDPTFETYDGDDPAGYVLSANNERRHLSLPERAAATALTLALDGRRTNGRWKYGAVSATAPESGGSATSGSWQHRMKDAGLILDYLGEARLKRIVQGKTSLDAEVAKAKTARAEQKRVKDLPDDLRVIVEAGELSVRDAERRASLSERYATMVSDGTLELDEAEHLNQRDEREYEEAIERDVSAIRAVVYGWPIASTLRNSVTRTDTLAVLSDEDETAFLQIEEQIHGPE
jgi:hypothetical protein